MKAQAYRRIEKEKWRRARLIAFYSMIGSHLDPKKLPKSEENWLRIDAPSRKQHNKNLEALEIMRELAKEFQNNE